jgi:hypothetical protein
LARRTLVLWNAKTLACIAPRLPHFLFKYA